MKEYGRELRVADFLRRELASIMRSEMRDPRVGIVSVTDVRVSTDLSIAKIYITSVGASAGTSVGKGNADPEEDASRKELLAVLNKAAGFLRSALARQHTMRTTPKLKFYYDDLIEQGARMESLIDKAVRADAPTDPDTDADTSK